MLYILGMDMEVELRKAVKDAIENSDLTQYRIALMAGISHGSMSQFISGNRSLSLSVASKLATTLGFELVQKEQERKA
jgi:DNA transposition AAA+ family ATPase